MTRKAFVAFSAVETVMRETSGPLRPLQIFDRVRTHVRDVSQVNQILTSLRKRKLVTRIPATTLPNDKSRFIFEWNRPQPGKPLELTPRLFNVYQAVKGATHVVTTKYLMQLETIRQQGYSSSDINAALRELHDRELLRRLPTTEATPYKGVSRYAYAVTNKAREVNKLPPRIVRSNMGEKDLVLIDELLRHKAPMTSTTLFANASPELRKHYATSADISNALMRLFNRKKLDRVKVTAEMRTQGSRSATWAYTVPETDRELEPLPKAAFAPKPEVTPVKPAVALSIATENGVPPQVVTPPQSNVVVTQEGGAIRIDINLSIVIKLTT